MGSLLYTIASFIVALAILIAVHEFGHFWVARKLGVKVLRFSIGFGKPLLRFRGADAVSHERTGANQAVKLSEADQGTEYVVAAIPLGGYVKMLDEREGEVAEKDRHRAFNRQTLPVRSAIVAAGPIFNLLFAIFAFWLINVTGDIGSRPLIGSVEEDSIAAEAGFKPGEEFVAVGDKLTPTWESTVYNLLAASTGAEDLVIRVRDEAGYEQQHLLPGEQLLGLAEDGRLLERMGLTPKRPVLAAVLGHIVPGEPADQAGLKPGDRVETIAGMPVENWSGLVTYIREHPATAARLQIIRQGEAREIEVIIGQHQSGDQIVGRIGAGVEVPEGLADQYRVEVTYGPIEAIGVATRKTWEMSIFMVKMLGRMIVGDVSVKNLSGPISIAQTAGKSASYGFVSFLKFLALVSISLGVLNLLPVPVLDGGHLFFFLLEALKGGPLSDQTQAFGQKIGLSLLLGLMLLAFYVDLSRIFG